MRRNDELSPDRQSLRHSPMGIASTAMAGFCAALLIACIWIPERHAVAAPTIMIAISGVAVAWEGRTEDGTSARFKRVGLWTNLGVLVAAVGMILIDVARGR